VCEYKGLLRVHVKAASNLRDADVGGKSVSCTSIRLGTLGLANATPARTGDVTTHVADM
jgi:hypothetical protein